MALYFSNEGGLFQSLTTFYVLLDVLIRNHIGHTPDPPDLFNLDNKIGAYLHDNVDIFGHLLELLG